MEWLSVGAWATIGVSCLMERGEEKHAQELSVAQPLANICLLIAYVAYHKFLGLCYMVNANPM